MKIYKESKNLKVCLECIVFFLPLNHLALIPNHVCKTRYPWGMPMNIGENVFSYEHQNCHGFLCWLLILATNVRKIRGKNQPD